MTKGNVMIRIRNYLQEMRIKHYIKNFLIFIPGFFAGKFNDIIPLQESLAAFISFSLISSAVYVINDINDIEKDRLHPIKCKRPIASGAIGKAHAVVLAVVLWAVSVIICLSIQKTIYPLLTILLYFAINLIYSMCGGKNYALLDIVLLVSGFYLRVLMGACVCEVKISNWLALVIISGASFLAFGKRRNEAKNIGVETRKVLNQYSVTFLDKAMYSCMTLSLCFFALWCNEQGTQYIILFPVLLLMLLKYSMQIERSEEGDPISLILKDKVLLTAGAFLGGASLVLTYW